MPYNEPVSDAEKQRRIYEYYKTGSINKAAINLGISRKALSKSLKRWGIKTQDDDASRAVRGEIGGPPIPAIAVPPDGFVIRQNNGQYDAEGNLKQQWIKTSQGDTDGYKVPAGHTIKGESAFLDANGNIISKWVKTRKDDAGNLIEAFREAFAGYKGGAPEIPEPSGVANELLCVYPIPDLHFGMLAWASETGSSYDMKIAEETALYSLNTLISRSLPARHAVLLGLGDFYHGDDQRNVTPGSGHQLDVDGRHAKVFAAGARLAIKMVELVAAKHLLTEFVSLSGNHDITSSMCLRVALSLFYANNPRITVNMDPGIAWYRRHGKCLIGATHGHTAKMDRLPGMMAADRPEDWGLSKYRSFYTGHVHTDNVREIAGVRVESLQAIAARDAWNASSGYRSGRSMSAITHHAEEGEVGRHRVNILS